MRHIPILIVGGGPVGLSLAVELGWRGVACELVEQTNGAIATPKMNEVNIRTMEICRRWGIADKVLNCPFPADFPLDVAFVTNLFGHEIGRIARPARAIAQAEPDSPYRLQACSQIWFDPILQERARSFASVHLSYRKRLESFSQDARCVSATLVDGATGEREQITAYYMVGCDGANSFVRQTLGIALEGDGTIGEPLHMFFKAPDLLKRSTRHPATFFLLVDKGGFWGNLRVIDPVNGIWRLMVDEGDGQLPGSAQRDAYLERALGHDENVEWLGVSVWKRKSVTAKCYGNGRVFLAGDAVHQLSPTGALGMNSGVADAVDLGWKLAATLSGWGGENLLASYDAERRPIGQRNVRMATEFYMNADAFAEVGEAIEQDNSEGAAARARLGDTLVRDLGREFRTAGLQIGYRYENSPICLDDTTQAPPDNPAIYISSAKPGARAPHIWLAPGHSTLDLFGEGFALLRFPTAPDASPLVSAANQREMPLTVFNIDSADAAKLYETKLVLARPDGHVAWRGDALPADPLALIDRIRGA